MKASKLLHSLLKVLVALLGSDLTDDRTGEKVARALMICWRGKIYLFGLEGKDQVIPLFLPQERMSFWKRRIGFTTHPRPDFPREIQPASSP